MFKTKKLFYTLLVGVIICTTLTVVISNSNRKYTKPMEITVYEEYTVTSQDSSIWQIAEKYPHKDIRRFVWEIQKASNTTAVIHEGQILMIPLEVEK